MYTWQVRFEWDDKKAERNLRKHGVSFSEAVLVFADQNAIEYVDELHSNSEIRHAMIGFSGVRLLYLVFTEPAPGIIRILHSRTADRRMRKIYEAR